MIETTTTDVSLAELHDIQPDSVKSVHLNVIRRHEPGAGNYAGIRLLNGARTITSFDTPADALDFIDDLHNHGLITAVGNQLDTNNPSPDDVIDTFDLSLDLPADEYIEEVGCDDPLNIDYTIHIEQTTVVDDTPNQFVPVDGFEEVSETTARTR